MKNLFEVELTLSDELPDLLYRFRQDAWEQFQRTLLGKILLFTDNHDWTDAQIVRASLTHMSPEQQALFKALDLKRYTVA